MAKEHVRYVCSNCEKTYTKWVGVCSGCKEYGTIAEDRSSTKSTGSVGLKGNLESSHVSRPARRVGDIDTKGHRHTPTGIGEFDRILGGGIVAGQTILLAGEPGVGKSTVLLAVANSIANTGKTVLYVSGEESAEQITLRARRTNTLSNDLFIADETDLSVLLGHIEEVAPDLLIVDSVQTLASPDVDGRAGGISQVQEVASSLTRVSKSRHMPTILVGQITKDGNIGGPKQLEHLVDTVIEFFGDKNTPLRIMRVIKNRFGPSDEVSCWEQTETGIVEVPDPSSLFRTGRTEPISGTCITVTMEGRRALLAEVQALVSPTNAPNPRRGVSGLDSARAIMLVAITEKHAHLRLFDKDTYLATVAGIRITEPAADLAVCLALASAHLDSPLPLDLCAIGEVTLSGDIRPVTNMTIRLNEAARLGFKRILVPNGTVQPPKTDIILIRVSHLGLAIQALKQLTPGKTKKEDSEGSKNEE